MCIIGEVLIISLMIVTLDVFGVITNPKAGKHLLLFSMTMFGLLMILNKVYLHLLRFVHDYSYQIVLG